MPKTKTSFKKGYKKLPNAGRKLVGREAIKPPSKGRHRRW